MNECENTQTDSRDRRQHCKRIRHASWGYRTETEQISSKRKTTLTYTHRCQMEGSKANALPASSPVEEDIDGQLANTQEYIHTIRAKQKSARSNPKRHGNHTHGEK
mmetsp:Transcript_14786/g.35263  ORF Transcript_14786/g.35263 Transcript_14786/m.35263 type:complete len:106 (+) Transcript_14786:95-412(+)